MTAIEENNYTYVIITNKGYHTTSQSMFIYQTTPPFFFLLLTSHVQHTKQKQL